VLVFTVFYRIILVCVNIIIITNYTLVRHVSTCIGHLQVTVQRNVVFGCLLYLSGSCYWCVVCSELCCPLSVFRGLCLFLALYDYVTKNRIFGDGVVVV
jgi:hypothetical protein